MGVDTCAKVALYTFLVDVLLKIPRKACISSQCTFKAIQYQQNSALLEEAKQMSLTVEARSGDAIAAAIRTVAELPGELVAKAARMTRMQQ